MEVGLRELGVTGEAMSTEMSEPFPGRSIFSCEVFTIAQVKAALLLFISRQVGVAKEIVEGKSTIRYEPVPQMLVC